MTTWPESRASSPSGTPSTTNPAGAPFPGPTTQAWPTLRVTLRPLVLSLFVVAALSGGGCNTKTQDLSDGGVPDGDSSTAPAYSARSARAAEAKAEAWAVPEPVPPELTQPLTIERIAGAKPMLVSPQPEPRAFARLFAQLGKPTKVTTGKHPMLDKEQKHFFWAAKSGTKCASYFVVEQPNMLPGWPPNVQEDSGDGTFEMPASLPTNGAPHSVELKDAWEGYAKCTRILGEEPALPPDVAGAPGPRPLVTKSDIASGLVRAPSKWLGKVVTVEGIVSGGKRASVETAAGSVDCRARDAIEVPKDDTKTKGAPKKRRVRGTVADLRVTENWGFDLIDCELLP